MPGMRLGLGLGITGAGGASPPAFLSASIDPTGTILTVTLSANVVVTGNGGLTLHTAAGTPTLTYRSGSGTASPTFTVGTAVLFGDTPTLDYSGTGLTPSPAVFAGDSVTNGSTYNVLSPDGTQLFTYDGTNYLLWA